MIKLNCGSFCVKYILERLGKNNVKINPDMLWITELALFLNKHISNKINVYYYNSKLMEDYYKNENRNFDGFKYIDKVVKNKLIILEQKELTISELKKEINNSKFIIVCVESSVLNNDNNMDGGHYIILEKTNSGKLIMYNPRKNVMVKELINYNEVLDLCIYYGSWRIVIEVNDSD